MTNPPTGNAVLTAAHQLYDAGCSVVPVALDGTKRPNLTWKPYTLERASPDQLNDWFAEGHPALGVICGAVSGNLEMLELEGRAVNEGLLADYSAAIADHGLTEIWQTILAGYLEQTPSGGIHILYRVADGQAAPNTKLARRPGSKNGTSDEVPKVEVLIETRGEGGFVVVAPTTGAAHPAGQPWTMLAGGPATIATITADQRDALFAIANMLDEMPAPVIDRDPTPMTRTTAGGISPGDDYNQRAAWEDILQPHGWKPMFRRGDTIHWTRPGKGMGTSATTGYGDRGDYLYIFTSSTELPSERGLSKFATYAHLEHNSNFTAAAKQLKADGYGQPAPEPTRPVNPFDGILLPTDGTSLPSPDPAHDKASTPTLTVIHGDGPETLARTDDGNALLLVEQHGNVIRYCPERGRWLTWRGTCWDWCEPGGGGVREYAKQVARALPDIDKDDLRHKQRSLGATGTSAMLTQAASDPRLVIGINDLDAHPWELNTPGGIIDLRTGQLGPSDPAKLHTRTTLCTPDTEANPARWHEFLTDTFGADHELISYLQRLVGYSAVGYVGPHVMPFAVGSGGNGKGVFLESLTKVLGDYATTAPSDFLMAKAHASHETELARLAGARMVVCSEVDEDDRFHEKRMKQLTGGDTITARFIRQDYFTFEPTHQLWLMGNHKPQVRSGGRSFWRRLRLIPFDHEVPDEKMVDDLQGILAHDHGPALLAWIVAGAVAFAQGGLDEPSTVKTATSGYERDQDTVSQFVDERCRIVASGARTLVPNVRNAYEKWCLEQGEEPVSAKALSIALQKDKFGIRLVKSNGRRYYEGLFLYADENDEPTLTGDRDPTLERYR